MEEKRKSTGKSTGKSLANKAVPKKASGEKRFTEKKGACSKAADTKYGEKKFTEKTATEKKYADKKAADKKYTDKKYTEKQGAEKKYGEKKGVDKKYAEKKYGDKKYAEKKVAEPAAVKDVDGKGNPVVKKASQGKFHGTKKEYKPWEKMNSAKAKAGAAEGAGKAGANGKVAAGAGKAGANGKAAAGVGKAGANGKAAAGAGKAGANGKAAAGTGKAGAAGKAGATGKAAEKKVKKELRDFLYLLPKRVTAKSLASVLKFIERRNLEIWEDECVLEIATDDGIITIEDIRESLEKEDKAILNDLRMKQVLSCDYESTNAELVQRIMEAFLKAFGGTIASDTEDFRPFLTIEEI